MKIIRLFLLLSCLHGFAQHQPKIIEATTDKNVFLFFPSPITKALSGNGNFHFGYNQTEAEKFGVLKAVSTQGESTLHIITEDQSVYSFILKYNKEVTRFEHFFDGSEAVGNIDTKSSPRSSSYGQMPEKQDTVEKITDSHYHNQTQSGTEADVNFCKALLSRKDYYKSLFKSNNNIILRVINIAYQADKTFIALSIENKSTVDFDLNFIQFNKIAKKASRKSNYQAIEVKPLLDASYQVIERVGSMQTKRAVYVFEKLSIDTNKLINIEINELQGERNVSLALGHKFINNPNN